jgi:hypothetical protein
VDVYRGHLLAVILTGMGRDGTAGCQLVQARGGHVLAQHADGCTVYGMPRSVINAGLANQIVKLPRIAHTINRLVQGADNRHDPASKRTLSDFVLFVSQRSPENPAPQRDREPKLCR